MNWIDSDRRTRYINVGRYLYRLFMFFSSAALGSIDAALGVLEHDLCYWSFASHTGGDSTRHNMHHIHMAISCQVCSAS